MIKIFKTRSILADISWYTRMKEMKSRANSDRKRSVSTQIIFHFQFCNLHPLCLILIIIAILVGDDADNDEWSYYESI